MEQSEFDTITTRVRHLRENITELQKNYDQLTLNVKVSGYVQQVNLDNVQTSINGVGYANICYGKHWNFRCSKFQNHERTNSAYTSSSSKLEENKTENQELKPDVSEQPSASRFKKEEINLMPQTGPKRVDTNIAGLKSCWWYNSTWEDLLKGSGFRPEHFITDVSGKYPRLWELKGANPIDVNRWYKFGALASIYIVAPDFREISELP
ncbi:hypothetical protein ACS0TY_001565 [Phlomoides rotata]